MISPRKQYLVGLVFALAVPDLTLAQPYPISAVNTPLTTVGGGGLTVTRANSTLALSITDSGDYQAFAADGSLLLNYNHLLDSWTLNAASTYTKLLFKRDQNLIYDASNSVAIAITTAHSGLIGVTIAGMLDSTNLLIHSNSISLIPTLSAGDTFYWSSNGVAYVICCSPSGVLTTNKLGP